MTREKHLRFSMSIRASSCGAASGVTRSMRSPSSIPPFALLFWLLSRTVATRMVALAFYCQQCKLHITANDRGLHECAGLNWNLPHPLVVLLCFQITAIWPCSKGGSTTWSFSAFQPTQMAPISSELHSLFKNHQYSKLMKCSHTQMKATRLTIKICLVQYGKGILNIDRDQ